MAEVDIPGMRLWLPNRIVMSLIYLDFNLSTALGLIGPVMAVFITEQIPGGDLQAVGFAVSSYYLAKSVIQLFVARYIDRRKESLTILIMFMGVSLMACVPFLYYFASKVWHIYALEALTGIGGAFFVPAWYALFTKNVDSSNISFEWSLDSVAIGASEVIAGALSGILAQQLGFKVLFLIAGAAGVGFGVLPSIFLLYNAKKPIKIGEKKYEQSEAFQRWAKKQKIEF
jgi:DHA1 family multidrug resistance protein-like MFS transporter